MLLEKPMRSVCCSWLACFGLILAGDPGTAAGDDTARGVTFYTVPLVCGAAPHIGCGGRAKPVLLELEKHGDVDEAWLNRAGTLLAVVWKDSSDPVGRDRTIQAVFEKHEMAANAVEGKEYRKLLKEFQGREGWLRGADVDKLSEEEAEVIAERLVRRIGAKTPLTEEKSETLKGEFAGTLKKRFNRSQAPDMGSAEAKTAAGRKKEIEKELLETGGKHLNEAERRALEEALALGMRPTEEESKRSHNAAPLEAPRQGSVPGEAP